MGEVRSRITAGFPDIFREMTGWNLAAELNPNYLPDPKPRRRRQLPLHPVLQPLFCPTQIAEIQDYDTLAI